MVLTYHALRKAGRRLRGGKKHTPPWRVDIWHNILWSQYKGEVFSSLYEQSAQTGFAARFFQLAETEGNRAGLGAVDLSRHRYPYDLLFKGSLDKIGFWKKLAAIAARTLRSDADLTILTGYEKPEIWLQWLILRAKGQKVAVFCDSTIFDQKQKFWRGVLKRVIFTGMNGIFCYGVRSREYALHYGANEITAFAGCQAAALPIGYTPKKALAMRLERVPPADAPRFLYVGRLSPEKSLDTLMEAFARVRKINPRAALVIVGNGPLREQLADKAQTLGIAAAVEFTGSKSGDALFEEYAKATALILPSISETWGLVVNEALSYGCPVIVSDRCGCLPELVSEGKTGFAHIAGDVADLAEKMLKSPSQFADIEQTARACIELMSNYTPDKAAEKILAGCRIILGI